MSEEGSFSDTMIPYLLDIWVFPEQFACSKIGSIGMDFARMFSLIWPAVWCVWPESLPALVGRQWDTGGTVSLWIF